jgi:hypothetical protein
MSTRSRKEEAFKHVMAEVLSFKADDGIMKAMKDLEYKDIDDLATMDKDEIMSLTYKDGDDRREVPMRHKKKLLHVLWWRNHLMVQRANGVVTLEDWMDLTEEKYEFFRATEAPKMSQWEMTPV